MNEITARWNGRAYGTNTGNITIFFARSSNPLEGKLRVLDHVFGLSIFDVTGSFLEGKLTLTGISTQFAGNGESVRLKVNGTLTTQGTLKGDWETSVGTGGTFDLFPHDLGIDHPNPSQKFIPEQIHLTRLNIGAIRIDEADLREISELMRQDFPYGRIIATYKVQGLENVRYFDDFFTETRNLDRIKYLKLFIQEAEAHGIYKQIVIELSSDGQNSITTQGIFEAWVIGKAEALSREIRRHESYLVTNIKKFGFGLNQFIFIIMLVFIPEIDSLWSRGLFAGIVLGLLMLIVWYHQQFIPNFVMFKTPRKANAWARLLPMTLSWLGTATASVVAAFAFYYLSPK